MQLWHEFSAGAVLVRQGTEPRFVLVVEKNGDCGFPKGHIEHGETEQAAALREIYEETGLHAQILPGFCQRVNYPIGQHRWKHVVYFAAVCQGEPQPLDVTDVCCLPYEEALRQLTFQNTRAILSDFYESRQMRDILRLSRTGVRSSACASR